MGVLWFFLGALEHLLAPIAPPIHSVSESLTELPARVRPEPVFFSPSHKSDYTLSAIKIVQFLYVMAK